MKLTTMKHLLAFVLILVGVASIAPRLNIAGAAENATVEYHYWNLSGSDLSVFYRHEEAIQKMAVGGNDYALCRFLEIATRIDGARGYSYFNLMVDSLRKVGDQRFARAISKMDPQTKSAVWNYLSGIGDLAISAPQTYAAVGTKELPDPTALALSDPGLMWP